jgi:regulator of protease activity HflC (stomatin/prohibitin superfamily)
MSAIIRLGLAILALALGISVLSMWGCPQYHVYEQEKAGEAEFKKAEQNRRVKVLEAQAKLDSAKLEAEAEIERAKGVAGANKIIADGLQGHEEYLRYLWIDKVAGGNVSREVVYVPTEANLPILEARSRTESPTPAAVGKP